MPFYTIQRTPQAQPGPTTVVALGGTDTQPSDARNQETEEDNELPSYDSLVPGPAAPFQPQSIVIDHSLIFPAEPPSNALYQLNHDLDSGNNVAIGRIDHTTTETPGRSPRTRVRDRPIYTFAHRIFNDKIIEITGKRKDCFAHVLMTKATSISGTTWKLCSSTASWKEQGVAMLHCKSASSLFGKSDTSFKWIDAGGKSIAIESKRVNRPNSKDGKGPSNATSDKRQMLNIMEPLEQKAVDLLITAWCARVWHDTLESNKVPLTPKEGAGSSYDNEQQQG